MSLCAAVAVAAAAWGHGRVVLAVTRLTLASGWRARYLPKEWICSKT
jgi:hypothetical protein